MIAPHEMQPTPTSRRRFVQYLGVLALQPITKGLHLAQGFLEIMRGHRGELLQFGVRTRQFLRPARQQTLGFLALGHDADRFFVGAGARHCA